MRYTGLISIYVLLLFYGCGLYGQEFDKMIDGLLNKTIPFISPDSLSELQKAKRTVLVLDAREKKEFDVSHIKGAVWVGYDDFDMKRVAADRNAVVVVYCSVGYRSEKIGEELEKNGYTGVYNLYGGIFNWVNKGYPTVDNEEKNTQKVHAYSESWGKWLIKGTKVYE